MQKISRRLLIPAFLVTAFLSGCSGSDSATPMGELTLRLTDLPMDANNIESVCVAFNRVTVHHVEQGDISIDYLPTMDEQELVDTHCPVNGGTVRPVQLNALAGSLSVALAESFQVPAGRISWIRLHFVPNESSVIDKDGIRYPLDCNSCEPTDNNDGRGFKLVQSFDIPVNGNLALMIDVDLRRALSFRPNAGEFGEYNLNPTARVEIDESLGGITGVVDELLIVEPGTVYGDSDIIDTGCAVYIFIFNNLEGPDDYYDPADPSAMTGSSPIVTSASVRYDIETGLYRYVAATLPGGTESDPEFYSAALTCDADDAAADENLEFVGPINDIAVVSGIMTSEVDFLKSDFP